MNLNSIKAKKAEAAKFMESEITDIIKNYGKRGPGMEGEIKACEHMADRLKEYGCDDVKTEPFDLHPAAFMGWIYITVTLILVAFALFFAPNYIDSATGQLAARIVALVLIAIGAAIMVGEFIMYREMVDKIYPKKTSCNVTALKKPAGEIKQRVFYNGHPDAACEWTFNYLGGGVLFGAHFVISMMGLGYFLAILIASFFIKDADLILRLGLGTLTFVPAWILLYVLWNEKQIVDGANDNLTGCYMGIAVLKALHDEGIELEHTEVGVIISGSEEAGLRGAKAWVKAHKGEFEDVPTYIISYDTIHEGKYLQVNQKDLNATVPADAEISKRFKAAADKLGVTCKVGTVPFGATDSAAFNQGGFRATGITAMNHNLQNYYHTRYDSYDNLDLDALADCYAVSVQILEDFENDSEK